MAKFAGIYIGMCVYVVVMASFIIRNPRRKKDESVLLRILTNYL
jgi:hypothetical protein